MPGGRPLQPRGPRSGRHDPGKLREPDPPPSSPPGRSGGRRGPGLAPPAGRGAGRAGGRHLRAGAAGGRGPPGAARAGGRGGAAAGMGAGALAVRVSRGWGGMGPGTERSGAERLRARPRAGAAGWRLDQPPAPPAPPALRRGPWRGRGTGGRSGPGAFSSSRALSICSLLSPSPLSAAAARLGEAKISKGDSRRFSFNSPQSLSFFFFF